MTNFYIIGDCHTSRIREFYDKDAEDLNIVFWGRGGEAFHRFDPDEYKRLNQESSYMEIHAPLPKYIELNTTVPFNEIKDDGVIIFWLGYIDVKYFLNKWNNAEWVIERFMDRIRSYFPNSKICFVEPFPQFIDWLSAEDEHKEISYEDRQIQNKLLNDALHAAAKKNEMDIIITQKDILDAIGKEYIDKNDFIDLTPVFGSIVDGLSKSNMKLIYDLFLKVAKQI
jgi:hypothetical protein